MREAQASFTVSGQLATLISDVDKGPLLAWLLFSDWKSITHLRSYIYISLVPPTAICRFDPWMPSPLEFAAELFCILAPYHRPSPPLMPQSLPSMLAA